MMTIKVHQGGMVQKARRMFQASTLRMRMLSSATMMGNRLEKRLD
jgi:hypothetical protein